MRSFLLGILFMIFISGCANIRRIEVPESRGNWAAESAEKPHEVERPRRQMYTRHQEGKYVIKPEPYSIASKKKDPELLGPQRTLSAEAPSNETVEAKNPTPKKPAPSGMTRQACISLIGEEKFNTYVQKYGGEKGALRRCLILKRIRG